VLKEELTELDQTISKLMQYGETIDYSETQSNLIDRAWTSLNNIDKNLNSYSNVDSKTLDESKACIKKARKVFKKIKKQEIENKQTKSSSESALYIQARDLLDKNIEVLDKIYAANPQFAWINSRKQLLIQERDNLNPKNLNNSYLADKR